MTGVSGEHKEKTFGIYGENSEKQNKNESQTSNLVIYV